RVRLAFDLALKTDKEGYNLYVSGPESVGRTIYTLNRLKEVSKSKEKPEDICCVNNFDNPLQPRYLLLPAGLGRAFAQDIDRAVEALKEEVPKAFESKEYEEEVAKITKSTEVKKEELAQRLVAEAQEHNLGVVFTPAGIKLLPIVGRKILTEEEVYSNPRLQESYEKNLSEFEERFRDFIRALRELDHNLSDQILELRNKVASYVVDKVFSRFEASYIHYEGLRDYLERLKKELARSSDLFLSWHTSKGNLAFQRMLEKSFNAFRVNVLVDNSGLEGAPVVFDEVPTFQSLFGRIFYTAEMGVLYADHMSLSAGNLHRARGGYLVLRINDLLKKPFLWDALKKVIMHKKIHMPFNPLEDVLMPVVGISPEPLSADLKVVLIGDPFLYYLLYNYDPEFGRLFKIKAEFDPVVDIGEELIQSFPKILRKIVEEEGLKNLSAGALSELFSYGVELSGNRKKFSVVFGHLVDVVREANSLSGEEEMIEGDHIRDAIRGKVFRSNLIEEKIRKAIDEGKIILSLEGEAVGQVNGLSVINLGDYSFGKPTRITASVYVGDKGIINIEREVELSGPIHSKGVLILSGYIGRKYGTEVPLYLSCTLAFEQSYDEVEGDSASLAELLAILSAIAKVPLKQYMAVTGSLDQGGNLQPVGGIKEKIEGFYRVCKMRGLKGIEGVVVPQRNYDNLVLGKDVLESIDRGEFNLYTVEEVDDAIEILTGMKAKAFHELVKKRLIEFSKKAARPPKRKLL
ncbi:MAG: AAA family ATPase, partial [Aquificaceae bacterium]|nr:AAA family ATPase [Aquificaceae bacterium]MCX8164103.1 AAA family ATPase [Aquificaceae bacterium]